MLDKVIPMSVPSQKTNLLKNVTFAEPGNDSSAVVYLTFSGTASIISTYMWLLSALIIALFQIEST